jgi:hypothetical protein
MPKRKHAKHETFLRAAAESTVRKSAVPPHPVAEVREEIKKAGGVRLWIKQSKTRLRHFSKYLNAYLGKTKDGKIKIPVTHRRGRWPKALRSSVKGYSGRPSTTSGRLSAGMPGNEETDPGPYKE